MQSPIEPVDLCIYIALKKYNILLGIKPLAADELIKTPIEALSVDSRATLAKVDNKTIETTYKSLYRDPIWYSQWWLYSNQLNRESYKGPVESHTFFINLQKELLLENIHPFDPPFEAQYQLKWPNIRELKYIVLRIIDIVISYEWYISRNYGSYKLDKIRTIDPSTLAKEYIGYMKTKFNSETKILDKIADDFQWINRCFLVGTSPTRIDSPNHPDTVRKNIGEVMTFFTNVYSKKLIPFYRPSFIIFGTTIPDTTTHCLKIVRNLSSVLPKKGGKRRRIQSRIRRNRAKKHKRHTKKTT